MALRPVRFDPEWFNEIETRGAAIDAGVSAYGYTSPGLTWYVLWDGVTPIFASSAGHATQNFNRVKSNVSAVRDVFDWTLTVPEQFTPTVFNPGERITGAKLEQLATVIEAAEAAMNLYDTQGPWSGVAYSGGGPTL